jgi:putative transposase
MDTEYRGYQRWPGINYSDGNSAFMITVCAKPHRLVFISEDRNQYLIEEMQRLQNECFREVYAFCIMPDHLHLVVGPGPAGLSAAVKRFKGRVTVWWRKHGDGMPLWQGGFFDHLIRSFKDFHHKCQYVLENPVRGELVEKAEKYPWSGSLAKRLFTSNR